MERTSITDEIKYIFDSEIQWLQIYMNYDL
jgi:hypothetical protein